MYRLLLALCIAGVLLPSEALISTQNVPSSNHELPIQDQEPAPNHDVSTYDTFAAIHSIYYDVTNICTRNEEACVTAKAMASNALITLKSSIDNLSGEKLPNQMSTKKAEDGFDETKTGSIEK